MPIQVKDALGATVTLKTTDTGAAGHVPSQNANLQVAGADVAAGNPVPVSGSVTVSNLPATQPVSGTVAVSNLPATQAVSGSVSVSNFPATQAVSATALGATSDTSATSDTGTFSLIALVKRALTNWTTLLARIPVMGQGLAAGSLPVVIASDQSRLAVGVAGASSATILSATTAAGGTAFTAFGSQACTVLDIVNNTGTAIEYQRGGAGNAIQIPTGSARLVVGITNASQVGIRRSDLSTTQVTVTAEAISA